MEIANVMKPWFYDFFCVWRLLHVTSNYLHLGPLSGAFFAPKYIVTRSHHIEEKVTQKADSSLKDLFSSPLYTLNFSLFLSFFSLFFFLTSLFVSRFLYFH